MTVRHIWPALVAGIILVLSPTLVHAVSPVAASTAGRAHAGKAAAACPPGSRASGTVRFSDWQFPDTLNPYQTGRVMTRQITNALFASLFRYDNRGRLAPQMAAAVPTTGNGGITDGGRTITVRLRQGLRWSNGAEITSRDIWFGWRVGMDNATGPACLGTCDAIARIDTPGRYTAVIRLKAPYAAAVSDAMPDVWPHVWPGAWNDNPKAAARKLGLDPSFNFESPRFPTSGAYQVATFVKDKSISLRPAPYCGGAIKNLTFVAYDTKRDLIDAAASKKTDLTTDYNLADLAELNKHNAYRVRVQTSFTLEHLELNLDRTYGNKPNPLADVRVRQA
ncbi:MAG: hypothetical protein JOZ41_21080, partial [Chloroflexi bacterium]|nr:hypothetical protein [Chloroflexota bacterium]